MNYNPIQYSNREAYSSTEILVRLDRTSLKDGRENFGDLPDDFVTYIGTLDAMGAVICPVFLEAIEKIPIPQAMRPDPPALTPPPFTFFPAAPLRQIVFGMTEYLGNDFRLYRRDGGPLTDDPSDLSPAQVLNVLTNFRIRYANPAAAVRALAQLRAMNSVAVAEPAPMRYIVVLEPRGEEGSPRKRRTLPAVGDVGVGVVGGIRGGGFTGVSVPSLGAGTFFDPETAAPALTAQNLATDVLTPESHRRDHHSKDSLIEAIYNELRRFHKQIDKLNDNITGLKKTVADSKCCEDKKSDVPDAAYQNWCFTAMHTTYDCDRGEGITMAMLDLGVDYTLADFQDYVTDSTGQFPSRVEIGLANRVPGKNAPQVLEQGQSYVDGLNPNKVFGFHGTAVAGVMVGEFTGFLPRAKMVSFQVSNGRKFSYQTDDDKMVSYYPVDSVLYGSALFTVAARDTEIEVINVSLGGSAPLCEFEKICYRALGSVNIRVVACSGNHFHKGDDPNVWFPARHLGILSVGAVGIEGNTNYYKRAPWSNFDPNGFHVNLMAPGVGVYSCMPASYGRKDNCGWFNGTSFAAPWIAAMYAWAVHQNIPFELPEISQKLFYQDPEEPFDNENGYGLVKFDKVVAEGEKQNGVWCYVPKSVVAGGGTSGGYGQSTGGTTTTTVGMGYQYKTAPTSGGPFNPNTAADPDDNPSPQ